MTAPEEMPAQIKPVSHLFDTIIQLQPKDKEVYIKNLKTPPAAPQEETMLFLDPTTMLIKRKK
jgi:hypothetical protein